MNKKVKTPAVRSRVRTSSAASSQVKRTLVKSASGKSATARSSSKITSGRTGGIASSKSATRSSTARSSVVKTTTPRAKSTAKLAKTSRVTSTARVPSRATKTATKSTLANTRASAKPAKANAKATKSAQKSAAKKSRQNSPKVLFYHRISIIARAICLIAFSTLVFVGVSQMVRAFSLEQVDNQNGIPSSWGLTSATNPDTIEVPITYWDQNRDCKMFEFSYCNISNAKKQGGLEQGIVKDYLGEDGLPVPTQLTANSKFYPTDQALTGHDPVQSTDNFYQWFHEVSGKSYKYDRTLTFSRVGDTNEYTYGGRQIFPLDDVASATQNLLGHNFHFTAHMSVPVKVTLSGEEVFDFSGDDDVWVFLNNRLVLDIGGVHTAIDGHFIVNADGSVTSYVDGKSPVTIDLGLQKGEVINLDFFYAERNTSEANTRITISDMEWPIAADAKLSSKVVDNKLIEYTASVTNRDPKNTITVERVAAYLSDQVDDPGFVPLSAQTLSYSMNNSLDPTEWQQLEVSAPASSDDGFTLVNPVTLAKYGETGDTLYVRYYIAPEANDIDYQSTVSFYTEDPAHNSGISYDTVVNQVTGLSVIPVDDPTDEPGDDPNDNPGDEPGDNPSDDPNNNTDPSDQPGDNNNGDNNDDNNGDPADQPSDPNTDPADDPTDEPSNDPSNQPGNDPADDPDNNNTNTDPADDPGDSGNSGNSGSTSDPTPSTPTAPTNPDPVDPTPSTPDPAEPANNNEDSQGTGGNTAPTTPSNDSADPATDQPAPAEPAQPAVPAYADATDDDDPYSTYLPVLGTVHYVPNTGVVTQLLSTPFNNQAFSSVILSQPFLLANLAVFAVSFAVFFPLRRY